MAILKSGVIVKLLEDIEEDSDEQVSENGRKPVLLQIRSIIPVLEEGDLWPNKGFYLKVSDMSHAIFVSLAQEENELVLNNKLQLGQFIYVQNFKKACPLPMLRGISPVPGRHTCEGTPKDILSPNTFTKLTTITTTTDTVTSDFDSIVEKSVISEKKIVNNTSDFKNLSPGSPVHPAAAAAAGSFRTKNVIGQEERFRERYPSLITFKKSSIEEDSDSDGGLPSSLSHTSKRKSWTTSDILRMKKETFDSSVIKHDIKPATWRRSRSATASPVRPRGYHSSDEQSSSVSRRRERDSISSRKLEQNANKIKSSAPNMISDQASHRVFSIINDRKHNGTAISWNSLPSRLLKLGKEVVRQRDVALNSAADALQEACAAERLLNSLSTYSDFIVGKGDDLDPYADKFFDLQDDLYHTKLIIQSLTNISPLKTSETNTAPTTSVKEAIKVALERKKDASSWIKTAVALDLSPCSMITSNPNVAETHHHQVKKTTTTSSNRVSAAPKGATIIKRSKTSDDMSLILQQHQGKDNNNNNNGEWGHQGSNLSAANDLVASLEDECRKLFLGYVEKYLDEVERKISTVESDRHIAGIMAKVKKVSAWLDVFIGKKKPNSTGYHHHQWCCTTSLLDESEMEAYGRVRNKIYGILLKHVERTAMVLQSINSSASVSASHHHLKL